MKSDVEELAECASVLVELKRVDSVEEMLHWMTFVFLSRSERRRLAFRLLWRLATRRG